MSDSVMSYLEDHEDCQCEPSEFECPYHTALSDYQQLLTDKKKAEADRDKALRVVYELKAEQKGLKAKRDELLEAVKWYGDKRNYDVFNPQKLWSSVHMDAGKRARDAVASEG